jgi:hypothetical protein
MKDSVRGPLAHLHSHLVELVLVWMKIIKNNHRLFYSWVFESRTTSYANY